MALKGIDISGYQRDIDLSKVAGQIDFVIVKATEGIGFVSDCCDRQYQQAKKLGLKRGFYHFARNNDAAKEAEYFREHTRGYEGDGIPVLDWEDDQGVDWVNRFVERYHELTGVWPWVYANPWRFNEGTVNTNCGRWVAGYPRNGIRDVDYGLSNDCAYKVNNGLICAWQFSSSVRLNGYGANLDGDVFYGDERAWDKYANPKGAASSGDGGGASGGSGSSSASGSGGVTPSGSTLDLVYHVVANGINGDDRRDYCGSRYDEVQDFINHVYEASDRTLAEEVKSGRYGNDPVRRTVLEACGGRYQAVQGIVNETARTYVVRSGDTLSAIAGRHGTTVEAIMAKNPSVSDPDLIYAGQRLVV